VYAIRIADEFSDFAPQGCTNDAIIHYAQKGSAMPLTAQAQALIAAMTSSGVPPFWTGSVAAARTQMAAFAGMLAPGPALLQVEDLSIPGSAGDIPARLYRSVENPKALLVYFHGGGWVFGKLDEFESVCRLLAQRSSCAVLSVGYRLAPEHPFPAAIEDAVAATRWAQARRWPWASRRLFVIGDSAGGNLAAAVSLLLRGIAPEFDGQILIYPVTAADMESPTYLEFTKGPTVCAEAMHWFWGHYVADAATRRDPKASPLYASDHSGLPPALILTAEFDPLRHEGEAYAEVLRRAGVAVQAHRYEGVPHGFFTMTGLIDESARAVEEASVWVGNIVRGSGTGL
jgi:acetyl esterase